MKDFDLRKYLSEGKLLKEDAISKLKSKVKDMSKEEFIKLAKRVGDLSKFKMASKGKKDDGTPIDPFSNVDDRLEVIDQNFDEKDAEKYLAEGKLIKENAPGYSTRKQGEALPTLESVKTAYEAKNNIKEGVDIDQMKIAIDEIASYLEDIEKEEEVMSNVLDRHNSDPFLNMGEVYAYLDGLLQKY